MAGVIPYLATSLTTVYLAWDLNHSAAHGTGVFLDAETAMLGLQILEPLQIGYGAVVSPPNPVAIHLRTSSLPDHAPH